MASSGLDIFRGRASEIEHRISTLKAAAKDLLDYLPVMQDDLFDTAIAKADAEYDFTDEDYQKILDISDGMDEGIEEIRSMAASLDLGALEKAKSNISDVLDKIDEVIYKYYAEA